MKAVICDRYGSPDRLRFGEVETPTPGEKEVLVRVRAASVNSWDWERIRGRPYILRLEGLRRPRDRILGADVAGVIVEAGSSVTRFRIGDQVFGDLSGAGWGGFAEYVCAPEEALEIKPSFIEMDAAAAVPQAAVMALLSLRHYGGIETGQKVLINGGGGGVGTFAIQMAKLFGAHVTGVDSGRKLELMKSIGADHVVDYRKQDFASNGVLYDLVVDCAIHRSVRSCAASLCDNGRYAIIGGSLTRIFAAFVGFRAAKSKKSMHLVMHKPNQDLATIVEYVAAGSVRPAIDRRFTLGEVPEAIRYLAEGSAKGKLVIQIGEQSV